MNKVKIVSKEPKMVKVEFEDQEFLVKPYLSDSDISSIKEFCFPYYFQEDGKVWDAQTYEIMLKLCIINLATNIMLTEKIDENDVSVFDSDIPNKTDLFEKIKSTIKNYYEVEALLYTEIENRKRLIEIRSSLGVVIETISLKALEVLEGLKDLDSEKLLSVGKELLGDIEKSPVSEVFKEASQQPKTKSKKAKE